MRTLLLATGICLMGTAVGLLPSPEADRTSGEPDNPGDVALNQFDAVAWDRDAAPWTRWEPIPDGEAAGRCPAARFADPLRGWSLSCHGEIRKPAGARTWGPRDLGRRTAMDPVMGSGTSGLD